MLSAATRLQERRRKHRALGDRYRTAGARRRRRTRSPAQLIVLSTECPKSRIAGTARQSPCIRPEAPAINTAQTSSSRRPSERPHPDRAGVTRLRNVQGTGRHERLDITPDPAPNRATEDPTVNPAPEKCARHRPRRQRPATSTARETRALALAAGRSSTGDTARADGVVPAPYATC